MLREKIELLKRLKLEDINHKEGKDLAYFLKEITLDILNPAFPMNQEEISLLRGNGQLLIEPIFNQVIEIFNYKINLFQDFQDSSTLDGYDAPALEAFRRMLAHYLGAIKIIHFRGSIQPRTIFDTLQEYLTPEAIKIFTSVSDWLVLNYFVEKRALKDEASRTRYSGTQGEILFIEELYNEGRINSRDFQHLYYSIKPEYRQELNWSYSPMQIEMERIAESIGKSLDELTPQEKETIERLLQVRPSMELINFFNITGELGLKMLIESNLSNLFGKLRRIVESLETWQLFFENYLDIKELIPSLSELLTTQLPNLTRRAIVSLTLEQLQALETEIKEKLFLANETILEALYRINPEDVSGINWVLAGQSELHKFLRAVEELSKGGAGVLEKLMRGGAHFIFLNLEKVNYASIFSLMMMQVQV